MSPAKLVLASIALLLLNACSPEVGSPEWCNDMKEKPRGDWTMNEAGDFAQQCLFPE